MANKNLCLCYFTCCRVYDDGEEVGDESGSGDDGKSFRQNLIQKEFKKRRKVTCVCDMCVCVCLFVYIYFLVCLFVCIYVCFCVHTCIGVRALACVCVHVCMYV